MEPSGHRKIIRFLPLLILLGVPLLVYLPSLGNDFVWDDHLLIQSDPWVHDLKHVPFLFSPDYWTHYFPGIKGQYRPLRALTFAVQLAVWGHNPLPFHAFNLLLHLANVWLVYRLLLKLTGRSAPAWLAAMLFALHPLHTEVVVWIKNRTEILSLLFSLLAIHAYLEGLEAKGKWRTSGLLIGSALGYFMALLSKEMAVSVPLLILTHAILLAPRRRRALAFVLPHLFLIALYVVFKVTALKTSGGTGPPPMPLDQHAMLVLRSLATYLGLLLAPAQLLADRPMESKMPLGSWENWLSAAGVLMILGGGLFLIIKKRFVPLFGLAWLLLGLLPVVNIHFLHTRPLADQRMYLPSVGFCLLLALGADHLRQRFPVQRWREQGSALVAAAIILLVSLYAARTLTRIEDWKEDWTLIQHTLSRSPKSARPHLQMGILHLHRDNVDDAAREFHRTIELAPWLPEPYNFLGMVLSEKKDHARALKAFQRCVQLKPDAAHAWSNMAVSLLELGKDDEAQQALQKAHELAPRDPKILTDLGIIRGRMGKYDQAIEAFDGALEMDPGNLKARVHRAYAYAEKGDMERATLDLQAALRWAPGNVAVHLDLATAYRKRGELQLALKTLQDALVLSPGDPRIHTSLGNVLMSLRQPEVAVQHFREAARLAPSQAMAYYNLARALHAVGDLGEAGGAARKALEVDPKNPSIHRFLAQILGESGEKEEARSHEEKATLLEADPGARSLPVQSR